MAIPKVIHRIWFGPRDMPAQYAEYGQDWRRLNPEWDLIDWTYETLPPLRNQSEFDGCGVTWTPERGDAKEATMIQVTQADIAAYEILYQNGGLYVNCDMKPIKPLPKDFCDHEAVFAYEIDGTLISNAFMAATAHHPALNAVIEAIPASVQNASGRSMDYVTGPRHLTGIIQQQYPNTTIWPARYCNPYLPNSQPTFHEDTIAIHYWGHATQDESLWPDMDRQPGAQRYF